MKLIDLVGKTYDRLTVICRTKDVIRSDGKNIPAWLCRCSCGNVVTVLGASLRSGNTTSCGCKSHTHGESGNNKRKATRLYRIWTDMKGRCYYPCVNSYECYGGRGIRICDEWRTSYTTFRDWALANGYNEKLSIDRINPDGNYEPLNCRWATASEQRLNQRGKRTRNNKGQYMKGVVSVVY